MSRIPGGGGGGGGGVSDASDSDAATAAVAISPLQTGGAGDDSYVAKSSGKGHSPLSVSAAGFLIAQGLLLVVFVSLVAFRSLAVQTSSGELATHHLLRWADEVESHLSVASGAQAVASDEAHTLMRRVESQQGVHFAVDVHEKLLAVDARVGDAIAKARTHVDVAVVAKLKEEMERVPIPKAPSFLEQRGQAQQAPRFDYDNEYPSEPVEELPGPAYVPPPDDLAPLPPDEQNHKRRDAVIDAFKHSWSGYVKHAWRYDELQPRSKTGKNWNEQDSPQQGLGLTVLDAITTMHVMGLTAEVEKALKFVKEELNFKLDVEASVFESTIRMLGGLLSIYELTGEKHRFLLDKATQLADRLLWAFNTSSGLPHQTVNLATHHHSSAQWSGGAAVLSEFGTVQLEFRTLSYHTKNPVYDMKATHIMAIVKSKAPADMLCPVYMSILNTRWMTDHISLGAMGDSFYEYLLKQYLLTNKTEPMYKEMFVRAANGIVDKLLFESMPSRWMFVAEYKRHDFYPKMDHLACFIAGTLALGAHEVDGLDRERMMAAAAGLTETCVLMYTRQKSGVSPEYVEFPANSDFINGPGYYILRPETFEALFYMWRLTKDQKWRDKGWRMFRAINRWCRVPTGGFAGLKEVNVKEPIKDNLQQSFWLAETLKYAYLLFADDDAVNLKEWVFNTEAHPLRIRTRDPMQVWSDYEAAHGDVPWHPPVLQGVAPIETAQMRQRRLRSHEVYKAKPDQYGEYEGADGAVDDDGMPFDSSMMAGIRRPGTANRPFGTPAPPARQPQQQHQQQQQQQRSARTAKPPRTQPPRREKAPIVDSEDAEVEDAHVEVEPKRHRPATEEERKAALEKQKMLRRAEEARLAREKEQAAEHDFVAQ